MLRSSKKQTLNYKKGEKKLVAAVAGALVAVARVLANALATDLTASAAGMEFPNVAGSA